MPEPMTTEQRQAFLAGGGRTATIATVRADGRPHAVPVWYVLDGDDIVLVIKDTTVKGRNLLRDPRVTVVVDDDDPPYAFVSIDGTAEFGRDPEEVRRFAGEIGRRYLNDEDAAAGFAEWAVSSDMVVARIRPAHIVALDKIAG